MLIAGWWAVGGRRRYAFLLSIGGNLLWMVRGLELRAWDVVTETALFVVIGAWGFWKWRKT